MANQTKVTEVHDFAGKSHPWTNTSVGGNFQRTLSAIGPSESRGEIIWTNRWSIPFPGEIRMDRWAQSSLKVSPYTVLVHGWLFPAFREGVRNEFRNPLFKGSCLAFTSKRGFQNQFRTPSPKVREPHFLWFGLPVPLLTKTPFPKKPLTRVSKPVPGAYGKRGLERGWQKRLAKGWRGVGEWLAKGWRRVSGFPRTLQFRNSRGARLETLVCDSMVFLAGHHCDNGDFGLKRWGLGVF